MVPPLGLATLAPPSIPSRVTLRTNTSAAQLDDDRTGDIQVYIPTLIAHIASTISTAARGRTWRRACTHSLPMRPPTCRQHLSGRGEDTFPQSSATCHARAAPLRVEVRTLETSRRFAAIDSAASLPVPNSIVVHGLPHHARSATRTRSRGRALLLHAARRRRR